MRQLCIVVGTSGSISLEDLINDFILTASALSSLIYLIR
jgi:purine-nucleoside phosphorylase